MVIGVITTVMGLLIEILKTEIENVDAYGELFLVGSGSSHGEVVAMAVIR